MRCTRWCSWLRHCATSRKVAGSILDGIIEIFHWHNPSGRTMAMESTHLTKMSTRNISWGVKAAGAQVWQHCHLHVPIVLKSGSLNVLEPSGPVQACNGVALPFFLTLLNVNTNSSIWLNRWQNTNELEREIRRNIRGSHSGFVDNSSVLKCTTLSLGV
jgi:hypothetical protein